MSEYLQRKEPHALTQPKGRPNKNTAEQTREAQLRELEYNLTRKSMSWLTQKQEEESKNDGLLSFVVPKGWGLNQIAEHLSVSVDDLKENNHSKLKNWGGVHGFNAGEIIFYPSNPSEKEESEKSPEEIINVAYNDFATGKIGMPAFAKTILP